MTKHRVIIVGNSLFADAIVQMQQHGDVVQVIGTASSLEATVTRGQSSGCDYRGRHHQRGHERYLWFPDSQLSPTAGHPHHPQRPQDPGSHQPVHPGRHARLAQRDYDAAETNGLGS